MDTSREVFADGIGDISLSNGMVRIDLISLSAQQKEEDGKPVFEFKQRIVLPAEGFLRSFHIQERWIQQLVDEGIIKRNEDNSSEVTKSPQVEPPEPPKSPNFG